jgi:hypothetical protein
LQGDNKATTTMGMAQRRRAAFATREKLAEGCGTAAAAGRRRAAADGCLRRILKRAIGPVAVLFAVGFQFFLLMFFKNGQHMLETPTVRVTTTVDPAAVMFPPVEEIPIIDAVPTNTNTSDTDTASASIEVVEVETTTTDMASEEKFGLQQAPAWSEMYQTWDALCTLSRYPDLFQKFCTTKSQASCDVKAFKAYLKDHGAEENFIGGCHRSEAICYAKLYDDLYESYCKRNETECNYYSLRLHYEKFGKQEYRSWGCDRSLKDGSRLVRAPWDVVPHREMDAICTLTRYTHLFKKFCDSDHCDLEAYYAYFKNHTLEEHIVAGCPVDKAVCYAARYPHLLAEFCMGNEDNCNYYALREHFVQEGRREGLLWGCDHSQGSQLVRAPFDIPYYLDIDAMCTLHRYSHLFERFCDVDHCDLKAYWVYFMEHSDKDNIFGGCPIDEAVCYGMRYPNLFKEFCNDSDVQCEFYPLREHYEKVGREGGLRWGCDTDISDGFLSNSKEAPVPVEQLVPDLVPAPGHSVRYQEWDAICTLKRHKHLFKQFCKTRKPSSCDVDAFRAYYKDHHAVENITPGCPLAEAVCYARRYTDLYHSYCKGSDSKCEYFALRLHYERYGAKDKRAWGCDFNPSNLPPLIKA